MHNNKFFSSSLPSLLRQFDEVSQHLDISCPLPENHCWLLGQIHDRRRLCIPLSRRHHEVDQVLVLCEDVPDRVALFVRLVDSRTQQGSPNFPDQLQADFVFRDSDADLLPLPYLCMLLVINDHPGQIVGRGTDEGVRAGENFFQHLEDALEVDRGRVLGDLRDRVAQDGKGLLLDRVLLLQLIQPGDSVPRFNGGHKRIASVCRDYAKTPLSEGLSDGVEPPCAMADVFDLHEDRRSGRFALSRSSKGGE
mmetsp:Transcript_19108/g.62992  ORF Transcript_19108/g.62992 Transcript_19108/m.62992 type:complete len:251 (-) Transcript_19108:95-847(-)